MQVLNIENVSLKYQSSNGEISAINDISFTANKGEFICLVGPSGCGKSTLLSVIAGLIKPTVGSVYIKGEKVNGVSNHACYMLQKDNLLEWRTVEENVMLGLELRNIKTKENQERAIELLNSYGLSDFKKKYPNQLSGGMKQRVSLIRTLAVNPDVLLLDEAFSALDYQTRLEVTQDVYKILRKEKITTIMVTHDIPESICMGDKILILSSRPARLKECLTVNFASDRTPISCRSDPSFSSYFNHIWKELSDNG